MKNLLLILTLSFCLFPVTAEAMMDIEQAICPVCRVHEGETEAEDVVASLKHNGDTYGFCSEGCRDKFLEAPAAYLPPVFPRPAPAFQVKDLEGNTFASEALKGRIVLLDFWATWCPPCVRDLPELSRLHGQYAERGVSIIGLSIDEGDNALRKIAKMVKRKKASHPVYLDGEESPAWAAYHVRAVPAQFLIDSNGDIVRQWTGTTDLDEVEAAIVELLDGKAESDS